MKRRQWELGKRGDGQPTILREREVLGNSWIDKLKKLGDNVVNYGPAHATSLWLMLRLFCRHVSERLSVDLSGNTGLVHE